MNKSEWIFIILLSITIKNCLVEHIHPAIKQQRRSEGRYKLSENDFKDREDVRENGFNLDYVKDGPQESFDNEGGKGFDYIPIEVNEDIGDEEMPKIRPRISHVNSKQWADRSPPIMIQDYEEEYNGDDDYLENNEDYVKRISYDPNISYIRKQNERAKRLSRNQDDGRVDMSNKLESDNYLNGEASYDFSSSLNINQPVESGIIQPVSFSSRKPRVPPSSNRIELSKTPANRYNLSTTKESNDLLAKSLKKTSLLSAPKGLNILSGTTNVPSQGFRNVIELNKAYKLLVCASNKFVKIANKTLTDQLIEECATANTVKLTTEQCKSQTTTCPSLTTESNNNECCAKTSFSINSNDNNDDLEETEDSLVDEILEITLKPKTKKEMSKKGLFSWIQSHDGDSYDNMPVAKAPPSRDDSNIYMYSEYDPAEEEEYEFLTTKTRAKTMFPSNIKGNSKSYEQSSTLLIAPTACFHKKEEHELISKVVVGNKSKSTTAIYPSSFSSAKETARTYTTNALSVSQDPEVSPHTIRTSRHKHRKHLKKNRRQKNIKSINARRSKINRKLLPIPFQKTVDPESITNQEWWNSLEKSLSTLSSDDATESGDALLPGQLYNDFLLGG